MKYDSLFLSFFLQKYCNGFWIWDFFYFYRNLWAKRIFRFFFFRFFFRIFYFVLWLLKYFCKIFSRGFDLEIFFYFFFLLKNSFWLFWYSDDFWLFWLDLILLQELFDSKYFLEIFQKLVKVFSSWLYLFPKINIDTSNQTAFKKYKFYNIFICKKNINKTTHDQPWLTDDWDIRIVLLVWHNMERNTIALAIHNKKNTHTMTNIWMQSCFNDQNISKLVDNLCVECQLKYLIIAFLGIDAPAIFVIFHIQYTLTENCLNNLRMMIK